MCSSTRCRPSVSIPTRRPSHLRHGSRSSSTTRGAPARRTSTRRPRRTSWCWRWHLIFRVEETPLQVLIEDDLETLMLAHWKESSTHQDADYDPDWPLALALERAGTLRAFGLFRDDELIGYSVYTISSHLLCKSTTFAFNTSIYVVPTRRGFAGGK